MIGGDYPPGATPVVATSGNVAAGVAAATLPNVPGKVTFITGFTVRGAGATAASVVQVTVAGLTGNVTMTFPLAVVAGATLQNQPMDIRFDKPIPAKDGSTAIVVSCPSLGAGNTANAVNAWGYQL